MTDTKENTITHTTNTVLRANAPLYNNQTMKLPNHPIINLLRIVLIAMHSYLKFLRSRLIWRLGKMRRTAIARRKLCGAMVKNKLRSFVARLKKIHAGFNRWWARINRHLGKMWVRVGLLFITVATGAILGKYVSPWVLCFFPEAIYGDARAVIGAIPFTLLTFLALWWFRTYDTIKRDSRANFEAGVNHVASDTPIRIEIGAEILINVSKLTSAYNREITITFIKRLKRSPADTRKNNESVGDDYRWGYAQHMLKWLKDHQRKNKNYDLNLLDLRYQEFTSTTATVTICDAVNMHDSKYLVIDVAGCYENDLNNFFGLCDRAYDQVIKKKQTHEAKLRKQPELNREPRTIKVTVSRNDCRADPFGDDLIG